MRRAATSRSASSASPSIFFASSSCTCRLAQRCHSSASRSSCTRGPSTARAASSRDWTSWRSFFVGSGRPALERGADFRQRAVAGLEGDRLGRGQRLDLPADLVQPAQVVLLLPLTHLDLLLLFLLDRGDRAFEPIGGLGVGLGVLAQHLGVASQPAPARDELLRRNLGGHELLELRGQRLQPARRRLRQHPPPLAILERAAGVLEATGQRGGVLVRDRRQRVPAHLQLGNAILGALAVQFLDLQAHAQAVGLLARGRFGPNPIGGALLLPLGNRFARAPRWRLRSARSS